LRWGSRDTPLDISDDGLEIIANGATNRPFTGSAVFTNGTREITETYLSGFLYSVTTNQLEAAP
jgi:hypothetical protein